MSSYGVYSFKDVVGSLTNPASGSFIIAGGNIGLKRFVISNATDRTSHNTAADGYVLVSYIAGDSGKISVDVLQNSTLDQFLVGLFNTLKTAADAADVSNWAATTVLLNSLLTGMTHTLTGASFTKVPDRTYEGEGTTVTWELMAANTITQ